MLLKIIKIVSIYNFQSTLISCIETYGMIRKPPNTRHVSRKLWTKLLPKTNYPRLILCPSHPHISMDSLLIPNYKPPLLGPKGLIKFLDSALFLYVSAVFCVSRHTRTCLLCFFSNLCIFSF